jgi:hypothetical protein
MVPFFWKTQQGESDAQRTGGAAPRGGRRGEHRSRRRGVQDRGSGTFPSRLGWRPAP